MYVITLELTLFLLFLKIAPEPVPHGTLYVGDIRRTTYKFPDLPMSIFEPA
jgi:hypothetical protein